ncbi:MAG: hypothetical protein FD126_789, partial [Elusimicrobia bacterium]
MTNTLCIVLLAFAPTAAQASKAMYSLRSSAASGRGAALAPAAHSAKALAGGAFGERQG